LECVRKSTESEFIEAIPFCGYIQDFNPVSPAHGSWNYPTRNRSSVYFRGIQFNQAARSIMEQEMTCDMQHQTDVTLVL